MDSYKIELVPSYEAYKTFDSKDKAYKALKALKDKKIKARLLVKGADSLCWLIIKLNYKY